ncbi:MAG: DUF3105 domain-containing protein [Chloroflexi bacterium]|nr:DUF3105 domain-containing protein [Chloroflexota bacterium]
MSMGAGADSTKREKRLAARDERKRRAAAAQQRARIRQVILLTVLAMLLVAVVVVAALTSFFGLMAPSIGQAMPIQGADHVADGTVITYDTRPPTSGPHYASPLTRFGMYDQAPPAGNWVHNLEHGAVAILYNCPNGCPEVVQELQDLYPTLPLGRNARGGNPRVVIFPYTDMDTKIAAVAWGWRLQLDDFDAEKLTQFVQARIDRGPECVNFACP